MADDPSFMSAALGTVGTECPVRGRSWHGKPPVPRGEGEKLWRIFIATGGPGGYIRKRQDRGGGGRAGVRPSGRSITRGGSPMKVAFKTLLALAVVCAVGVVA